MGGCQLRFDFLAAGAVAESEPTWPRRVDYRRQRDFLPNPSPAVRPDGVGPWRRACSGLHRLQAVRSPDIARFRREHRGVYCSAASTPRLHLMETRIRLNLLGRFRLCAGEAAATPVPI